MAFKSDLQKSVDKTYSNLGISPDPTQTFQETGIPMARPQYIANAPIDVVAQAPVKQGPSAMDLANQDMQNALKAQQDALAAAAVGGTRAGKQQAGVYNQLANQVEQEEIQRKAREADRQKRMDAERQKLDKAVEDYSNMNVDPKKFFNDLSTGQKILGGIGVFLGGLSLKGGPNQSLSMIENAINRDIDAQKANISSKGKMVDAKRGMYQDMLSRFGDERQAENAARIAMLTATQAKANAIGAKLQGQENQLKLTTLNNDIEAKKAQYKLEMAKRAELLSAENQLYNYGGADGGMSPQFQKLLTVVEMGDPEKAAKMRTQYARGIGFEGIATTPERAKMLTESSAQVTSAQDAINRLLELGRKSGREFLPTEAKAEAESLKNMLQGMIRAEIVGPGAVSESEWKMLDSVVANPTDVTQINAMSKLETLRRNLINSLQNKAKAEGIPVKSVTTFQKGPARNPGSVGQEEPLQRAKTVQKSAPLTEYTKEAENKREVSKKYGFDVEEYFKKKAQAKKK